MIDFLESVPKLQQGVQSFRSMRRTGERKSPQMAAMSDMLTDVDAESLAVHYARQRARAVVCVMVPSK
jgi:cytochrome c553